MRVALIALLGALLLSSCSIKRGIKCSMASGDAEACRALADECNLSGGPRCDGACPGAYCGVDEARTGCGLQQGWERNCPRDSRIFSGGRVGDLEKYKWAAAKMSPAAVKLSGKQLTKEDVASITQEDRRQICGAYPQETCELAWDEGKGYAVCHLPVANPCGGCQLKMEPWKCTPKNLCSGVICL